MTVRSASIDRFLLPAVLVLALLVFAKAVGFPFVNWDDPSHFLQNPLALHPLAQGWAGLFWTRDIGYPAPVLQLSFALDRALFGTHPGPWHAENLLLHLADVAMLHALARRLGLSLREAAASAALFALHPLVVEPVCWVTGRKDVLSMALLLAACLVATRGARTTAGRWIAANVLAALAVLVLPRMIVAAPFVAVVVDAVRRPAGRCARARLAATMAPAFAFAVFVAVLGLGQIRELGAVPPPRAWSAVLGDVAGAWGLQFRHLVFPIDLAASYFRVPGDPSLPAMLSAAVVALAAAWLAARRTTPGSPERTGLVLALLAYAPVSCIFTILRWTADSYMYLPLAALSLAVVPAVARRWPARLARFGRAAACGLFVLLGGWSLAYTPRWSSSTNVWQGGIARYPGEPLAWEHEALGLRADGRTAEANVLFMALADRFPDFDDSWDDEVLAFEARGDVERARRILAHGVRAGASGCIRMFWMRLLREPERLGPVSPGFLALAFDNGFEAMKAGLHDRASWERVAGILRQAGLADRAVRVDKWLASAARLL